MNFLKQDPSLNKPMLSLLSLIAIFAVGFGGGWLGARSYDLNNSPSTNTEARKQYVLSESQLIAQIAKSAGAGVVSVNVQREVTAQDVFGQPVRSEQESAGTGFVVSADGVIVTNRHVVPVGTINVSVTFADGSKYDQVQIVGRTNEDNPLDVAFLKIGDLKGKKLTALSLGDSSKVQVGERVIAIGNALGQFQNTVTLGIISGYGRDVVAGDSSGQSLESLTDLFQTDAAINEGNSGGPLVNINGEAIGVNTAIAGGAQNIGFAIPINDIKGLIKSVLSKGKLEQPYLGVRYVPLSDELAAQYGLGVKRGAYIVPSTQGEPSILAGSPAEKAGLKEGDIITQVNNTKIDDKTNLTSALAQFQVGDKVKLTIIRGDKTISLDVTLAAAPQS